MGVHAGSTSCPGFAREPATSGGAGTGPPPCYDRRGCACRTRPGPPERLEAA